LLDPLPISQALPERRLLFGIDLRGAAIPAGNVYGAVRDSADFWLAGPVERTRRRPRTEDRPAQADLHRPASARLRSYRQTLTRPMLCRAGYSATASGYRLRRHRLSRLGRPTGPAHSRRRAERQPGADYSPPDRADVRRTNGCGRACARASGPLRS